MNILAINNILQRPNSSFFNYQYGPSQLLSSPFHIAMSTKHVFLVAHCTMLDHPIPNLVYQKECLFVPRQFFSSVRQNCHLNIVTLRTLVRNWSQARIDQYQRTKHLSVSLSNSHPKLIGSSVALSLRLIGAPHRKRDLRVSLTLRIYPSIGPNMTCTLHSPGTLCHWPCAVVVCTASNKVLPWCSWALPHSSTQVPSSDDCLVIAVPHRKVHKTCLPPSFPLTLSHSDSQMTSSVDHTTKVPPVSKLQTLAPNVLSSAIIARHRQSFQMFRLPLYQNDVSCLEGNKTFFDRGIF
jgi:hypothetical protein